MPPTSKDAFFLYNGEPIAIFDIPRSSSEFINYATIEKIKDGLFVSTKYTPV